MRQDERPEHGGLDAAAGDLARASALYTGQAPSYLERDAAFTAKK